MPEDEFVSRRGRGNARDGFFRNDQKVYRCLRLNIVQSDTKVILMLEFRWNFPIDDFLEDRFGHGGVDFFEDRRVGADDAGFFSSPASAKDARQANKVYPSEKQQLQAGGRLRSGGGEALDKRDSFVVFALAPGRGAAADRNQRRPKIRDK